MNSSDVLAKCLKEVEPIFTASLGEMHRLGWLLIDLGGKSARIGVCKSRYVPSGAFY